MDFRADDLRPLLDLRPVDLRPLVDFRPLEVLRPPEDLRPEDFLPADLRGTLPPFARASDKPIAIACFLLVTFLPLPDFSVPFFLRRIVDATRLLAAFPYFLPPDDFRAAITKTPDWGGGMRLRPR